MTYNPIEYTLFGGQRSYITQVFDNPSSAYPYWGNKHKGVDFGTDGQNLVLKSPVDGKIVERHFWDGKTKDYGNHILIFDGKFYWLFAHLEAIFETNDHVRIGDDIGIVGTSGFSTGIHLHLGCYRLMLGMIKKYYDPIIIYNTYMEEIYKRLEALERTQSPNLRQMKGSGEIRIVNDEKKTFAKIPDAKAGAYALSLFARMKGKQYTEEEFGGYSKVPFSKL